MSTTYDGSITTPQQHGRRKESFPFDYLGNSYAKCIEREYQQAGTAYTKPETTDRTSYTNWLLRSQDYDTTWSVTNGTATDNSIANPSDGTVNAGVFFETTANAEHYINQGSIPITATATTFSVFAKYANRDWIRMFIFDGSGFAIAAFNLNTGVIGTVSGGATARMTALADGWYRCEVTFTAPSAGTGQVQINTSTDGTTISFAGSATSGFYLYGAQIERASTSGPYVVTTSATRSVSAPNTDQTDGNTNPDPFAFLCEETPPADGSLELGVVEFTRTYCRIPATQTEYTNKFFQRPIMDDVFSATAYAVSFDDGVSSHVFHARKTVSSISAVIEAVGTLPAENFDVVDSNGNTSTQSFNTYPTTLRSNIIATCTTITGLVVTGDEQAITISWTANVRAVGTNSVNVRSSGGAGSVTFTAIPPAGSDVRTVYATGHGGVAGDFVVLWNGDRIVAKSKVITAAADSFTIPLSDLPENSAVVTACGFSSDAYARYVNGLKMCSIKRDQYFYLPGYHVGISTGADIPNFQTYTDPTSWLGRIIAVPTGYAAIEVSELDYWRGPIQTQVVDEIQMSDAIDTITP